MDWAARGKQARTGLCKQTALFHWNRQPRYHSEQANEIESYVRYITSLNLQTRPKHEDYIDQPATETSGKRPCDFRKGLAPSQSPASSSEAYIIGLDTSWVSQHTLEQSAAATSRAHRERACVAGEPERLDRGQPEPNRHWRHSHCSSRTPSSSSGWRDSMK